MSKKFWLVVFVSFFCVCTLTGCHSKFQYGDITIAQEDIRVVEDYNAPTLNKPTCTIHEGDSVTISGFSTLSMGSSAKQGLIELSSSNGCVGWAFDDISLNNKLK